MATDDWVKGRPAGRLIRNDEVLAETIEIAMEGTEDHLRARFPFEAGKVRAGELLTLIPPGAAYVFQMEVEFVAAELGRPDFVFAWVYLDC